MKKMFVLLSILFVLSANNIISNNIKNTTNNVINSKYADDRYAKLLIAIHELDVKGVKCMLESGFKLNEAQKADLLLNINQAIKQTNKDLKSLHGKGVLRILLGLWILSNFAAPFAVMAFVSTCLILFDMPSSDKQSVLLFSAISLIFSSATGYFSISQIKKGWNNHDVKISLNKAYIIKNILNRFAKT